MMATNNSKKIHSEGDEFLNSSIVYDTWRSLPNYLIQKSSPRKDLCVIYFSSHGIYFPNDETTFRERILSRNYFDWYKSRISNADKHIFVRDVFKQWYLKGINKDVPNQDALLDFLRKETLGYNRVVTVGSSGGGYAAILFGCNLNAYMIFAFSPRISFAPLIETASSKKNPILLALRNTTQLKNSDLTKAVNMDSPKLIYFFPIHSQSDIQQHSLLNGFTRFRTIKIISNKHGVRIPFECLNVLLNYTDQQWSDICSKVYSPYGFSLKVLGPIDTIRDVCQKSKRKYVMVVRQFISKLFDK